MKGVCHHAWVPSKRLMGLLTGQTPPEARWRGMMWSWPGGATVNPVWKSSVIHNMEVTFLVCTCRAEEKYEGEDTVGALTGVWTAA